MKKIEVGSTDWHRIDIIAALHKRGVTLRDLSREAGLHPDSLKNVLYRPCRRYESIIAGALSTEPNVIWPSRYADLKRVS